MANLPSSLSTAGGLGRTSLAFGLFGGVFAWWMPVGLILSLTGLVLALLGAALSRPDTVERKIVLGAILVSLATLVMNCAFAAAGLDAVKFPLLE